MHQPFKTYFATTPSNEAGFCPASGIIQITDLPLGLWRVMFERRAVVPCPSAP
jgi:hypothetical protein